MKYNILIYIFSIALFVMACEKEGTVSPHSEIPAPSVSTTAFTATVSGSIPDIPVDELLDGLRGVLYTEDVERAQDMFNAWQEGKNNPGCSQFGKVKVNSNGVIESTLSGLKPETRYEFCLYYQSKSGKKRVIGKTAEFTTGKFQCTIECCELTNVRFYDALLSGSVTIDPVDMSLCKVGVTTALVADDLVYDNSHKEASLLDDDGSFSVRLNNLNHGTEYFFKTYVLVEHTGDLIYGPLQSFSTRHTDEMAVDLGLSVKWASCNLGAQEPYETGGYYKWGETEPSTSGERSEYIWWDNDSQRYLDIGEDICGTEYDAAHTILSGHWRMPTKEEIDELTSICEMSMHTMGDYYVVEFSNNGASISLPVAGTYSLQRGVRGGNYDPSNEYLKATLFIQSGTRSTLNNEGEVALQKYERCWSWYVNVMPKNNEVVVKTATGQKEIGIVESRVEFAIPIRPVWDPALEN